MSEEELQAEIDRLNELLATKDAIIEGQQSLIVRCFELIQEWKAEYIALRGALGGVEQ